MSSPASSLQLRSRRIQGSALPPRLADLPAPPPSLYVRGELPRGPAVAIVGTRSPTAEALQYARHLAGTLAAHGVAILSGGAVGIDAAAHRGALDVGGCSVVVAPSGFRQPYPPEHRALYEEVLAAGGAYVSRVPANTRAHPSEFFRRNELLVALSHALVVVQAGYRSGARNAAKHGRLLGRPVFVVTWPPWCRAGQGCLQELALGARPVLGPRSILDGLRSQLLHPMLDPAALERAVAAPGGGHSAAASGAQTPEPGTAAGGPDMLRDRVLQAIRSGALHVDDVCARTGLPVSDVQRQLLALVLEGAVDADPHRLKLVIS